ncbi:respiratory chain complex I subunit 1 family protein [Leptospirillum ferriphilum]|jgi:formate hydrogenlyase subunit 4|nr:NADH-quinone oxidoreductase subunit H [Leptospirillum ferriphilum]
MTSLHAMAAFLGQSVLPVLLVLLLAPLFAGWLAIVKALLSNRTPPGLFQPCRDWVKLLSKETIVPEGSSALFRWTPPAVFSLLLVSSLLVPVLGTGGKPMVFGDALVFTGIMAFVRVMMALGAFDTGTPFGHLGGRREMMVGFLAEPATVLVIFTTSLFSGSTMTFQTADALRAGSLLPTPSLVFGGLAFLLVLLGENARIPIDNPATHLELTMIHEAMLLEYTGPSLALMEWGSAVKLVVYLLLGIGLFFPWGLSGTVRPESLLEAGFFLLMKLLVAGLVLGILEVLMAKLRIFRVPEFMTLAFLLAILGFLSHFVLEV